MVQVLVHPVSDSLRVITCSIKKVAGTRYNVRKSNTSPLLIAVEEIFLSSSCRCIALKTAGAEVIVVVAGKKGNPFVFAWPHWTAPPCSAGRPLCSGEWCSLRGTGESISCLVNRWLDAPRGKQSNAVCHCFFFLFVFLLFIYNGWRSVPGNTKNIQKGVAISRKQCCSLIFYFFWSWHWHHFCSSGQKKHTNATNVGIDTFSTFPNFQKCDLWKQLV